MTVIHCANNAELVDAWREELDLMGPFANPEQLAVHATKAPPGAEHEASELRGYVAARRRHPHFEPDGTPGYTSGFFLGVGLNLDLAASRRGEK